MFNFTATKIISLPTILATALGLFNPLTLSAANQDNQQLENLPNTDFQVLTPAQLFNQPTLIAQRQDLRKRVALVIGNADYTKGSQARLNNPVHDATDIAAKLKEVGFEVILLKNGDLREMKEKVDQFYRQLSQNSVGLFYYAGHGIQVDGENYLIPTDAELKSKSDVNYETLPLGQVLDKMYEVESEVKIIILDACRDNPYARNWKGRSSSRARGLALQSTGKGLFIAYATEPGNIALDGEGRNGIFTSYLLKHLTKANLKITDLFSQVAQEVYEKTYEFQLPFYTSGLIGDFYFNPSNVVTSTATPKPKRQSPTTPSTTSSSVPRSPTIMAAAPNKSQEEMLKRLEEFLQQQDFSNADKQTWELMKQIANGGSTFYVTYDEIKNFSCSALRKMDNLWLEYSQGKFGYSVQKNIWQSIGGNSDADLKTFRRFAIKVGWKTGSDLDATGYITYSNPRGPQGHYPFEGWFWVLLGKWDLKGGGFGLFSRCEL